MRRPAAVGGSMAFPDGLRFARPLTPPLDRVMARLAPSYEEGVLTNGPLVRALEERAAERLGVRHAVAVGSCTSGLILALGALEPAGPVVLPSFTFVASAHAVAWNGLRPVFCECRPDSLQVDVADVAGRIDGADAAGRIDGADAAGRIDGAGAILATHVFGAPCDVEALVDLAGKAGVPVVFDAAHAFGATRAGASVGGFGAAEVFSLSPTKVVATGEGGLVATNRDDVAERVRLGRNYGDPGDYDARFLGLNARLSELHAALALEALDLLDEHLEGRRALARRYVELLDETPGVAVQAVDPDDRSTYKDFSVIIDEGALGLDRDEVAAALGAEGIDTRRYFWPPVHRQQAYAHLEPADLPRTDAVAGRVLSLPMFGDLATADVEAVAEALACLHAHADEVRAGLGADRRRVPSATAPGPGRG